MKEMWGTEEKQESLCAHSYSEHWSVHPANSKSLKRTQRTGGGAAPQKASSLPVDRTSKSARKRKASWLGDSERAGLCPRGHQGWLQTQTQSPWRGGHTGEVPGVTPRAQHKERGE